MGQLTSPQPAPEDALHVGRGLTNTELSIEQDSLLFEFLTEMATNNSETRFELKEQHDIPLGLNTVVSFDQVETHPELERLQLENTRLTSVESHVVQTAPRLERTSRGSLR